MGAIDGDISRCCDDLRLPIRESRDDGRWHDGCSDNLPVGRLRYRVLGAARYCDDGDGLALFRPCSVVQVVEAARPTLVECLGRAQRQPEILADGESAVEESASLRRSIELELVVGSNISSPTLCIHSNSVVQRQDESSLGATCPLLYRVISQIPFIPGWPTGLVQQQGLLP